MQRFTVDLRIGPPVMPPMSKDQFRGIPIGHEDESIFLAKKRKPHKLRVCRRDRSGRAHRSEQFI
jgi:hypothetical protein